METQLTKKTEVLSSGEKTFPGHLNFVKINPTEFDAQKQQIVNHIEKSLQSLTNNTEGYWLRLDIIPQEELKQLQNLVKQYFDLLKQLSRRELQVLKLALDGHHNQEISKELHISAETVKTHRKNIISKANFSNVQEMKSFFYKVSRVVEVNF
jgi:ATP/maltotriose-dependent transcriptional regulator MalT